VYIPWPLAVAAARGEAGAAVTPEEWVE